MVFHMIHIYDPRQEWTNVLRAGQHSTEGTRRFLHDICFGVLKIPKSFSIQFSIQFETIYFIFSYIYFSGSLRNIGGTTIWVAVMAHPWRAGGHNVMNHAVVDRTSYPPRYCCTSCHYSINVSGPWQTVCARFKLSSRVSQRQGCVCVNRDVEMFASIFYL